MPLWSIILNIVVFLASICTILTFIFSPKFRNIILKTIGNCFYFLKKLLWSPFFIIKNISNIPLLHDSLEDLYESVREIERTLANSRNFPTVPLGKIFTAHSFLWHCTDDTNSKVSETPVCLYCYEIGQVFVHMKDISNITDREFIRTFRCPHCKEQVDILTCDYKEDIAKPPF